MLKKMINSLLLIFVLLPNITLANDSINKFKDLLKQIDNVAIDFIQNDTMGASAHGKLLIKKPYKFRCNYYPPYPLLIVGNKSYVALYDYEMEQISRINPEENIFNFLLVNDFDFEKYFIVESINIEGNEMEITLHHIESDKDSKIVIDKRNGQLKTLEIFEDDRVINISFNKIEKISEFDGDLFTIKNPEIFGVPQRITKEQLEKKYIIKK